MMRNAGQAAVQYMLGQVLEVTARTCILLGSLGGLRLAALSFDRLNNMQSMYNMQAWDEPMMQYTMLNICSAKYTGVCCSEL